MIYCAGVVVLLQLLIIVEDMRTVQAGVKIGICLSPRCVLSLLSAQGQHLWKKSFLVALLPLAAQS